MVNGVHCYMYYKTFHVTERRVIGGYTCMLYIIYIVYARRYT